MNRNIIIVAVGIITVGMTAHAAVDSSDPGTRLHTFETTVVEPTESAMAISSRAEAEFWAEKFAERLVELDSLENKEELNKVSINQVRTDINESFDRAFDAIQASEVEGMIEETAIARATMQTAIEYQLTTSKLVDTDIYNDLQNYSQALTESLIQVAMAQ